MTKKTVRKIIIDSLKKKYQKIIDQFKIVENLENEVESTYGVKRDKLEKKYNKENEILRKREKELSNYLVDKKVTEDEWGLSGLEDLTCCELVEYIEEN